MPLNTLEEIEHAVTSLSAQELESLRGWLDEFEHPLDRRIQADLSSGLLDQAISQALDDEKSGRTHPL